jgi:hypothetical protein
MAIAMPGRGAHPALFGTAFAASFRLALRTPVIDGSGREFGVSATQGERE